MIGIATCPGIAALIFDPELIENVKKSHPNIIAYEICGVWKDRMRERANNDTSVADWQAKVHANTNGNNWTDLQWTPEQAGKTL